MTNKLKDFTHKTTQFGVVWSLRKQKLDPTSDTSSNNQGALVKISDKLTAKSKVFNWFFDMNESTYCPKTISFHSFSKDGDALESEELLETLCENFGKHEQTDLLDSQEKLISWDFQEAAIEFLYDTKSKSGNVNFILRSDVRLPVPEASDISSKIKTSTPLEDCCFSVTGKLSIPQHKIFLTPDLMLQNNDCTKTRLWKDTSTNRVGVVKGDLISIFPELEDILITKYGVAADRGASSYFNVLFSSKTESSFRWSLDLHSDRSSIFDDLVYNTWGLKIED
jgi:hypothetical protein